MFSEVETQLASKQYLGLGLTGFRAPMPSPKQTHTTHAKELERQGGGGYGSSYLVYSAP